jgi:hypothetical protein
MLNRKPGRTGQVGGARVRPFRAVTVERLRAFDDDAMQQAPSGRIE